VVVVSTAVNLGTVAWCRSVDDARIPVHGIVTVPDLRG
jgi:hypothetical protein